VRAFALALMAIQGVALLGMAFAESRVAILASVALFGITIGNSLMMHPLLLADRYGTREYGRIYSMSQFVAMAGVAGGPAAIGIIYEQSGGYTIPFAVMAVATVLGLLTLQFGSRK